MDQQMFCFQCEQTAGCAGCMGKAGVCGKSAGLAKLQDELTGALIGMARATEGRKDPGRHTWHLIIEGLFATVTNVNFDEVFIQRLIDQIHAERERLVLECGGQGNACGRNDDYDMDQLWGADEDIRSLKSLILFGIRGMLTLIMQRYWVIRTKK